MKRYTLTHNGEVIGSFMFYTTALSFLHSRMKNLDITTNEHYTIFNSDCIPLVTVVMYKEVVMINDYN